MATSPAHLTFASLTTRQRLSIARDVFEILEYDSDGNPGAEWSSDTTQALGDLFARFGVTFTDPNDDGVPR